MTYPGPYPRRPNLSRRRRRFRRDTLFMPDYGTARADFPGGDAGLLYRSIRRILELPADTRLFTCHDYKAAGRDRYATNSSAARRSGLPAANLLPASAGECGEDA